MTARETVTSPISRPHRQAPTVTASSPAAWVLAEVRTDTEEVTGSIPLPPTDLPGVTSTITDLGMAAGGTISHVSGAPRRV